MTLAEHLKQIAESLQKEIGYPFSPTRVVKTGEEADKIFAYGYAIGTLCGAAEEWEKKMQS